MKSPLARWIVAGMLLFFAWRGATLKIQWPLAINGKTATLKQPDTADLKWAAEVKKVAARMTPKDRLYCSNFYAALQFVIQNDGDRDDPIISDTTKFQTLHSGSLDLAIKRGDVGKYAGLGEAIDQTFIAATGASAQSMTPAVRAKVTEACGVLAWTFAIHGE